MSEDRARHHLYRAGVSVLMNGTLAHRGDIDLSEGVFAAMEALASEREAIGRAAGREEAIKLLERKAREHGRYITQARKLELGEEVCARDRAAQYSLREVRDRLRALPVDGGKDGAA